MTGTSAACCFSDITNITAKSPSKSTISQPRLARVRLRCEVPLVSYTPIALRNTPITKENCRTLSPSRSLEAVAAMSL